ncbi:MAG TPA: hypothetical protein VKG23_05150, partial [Thermoanaerobaculia bacterium]|nr:hypothetical protein [Thermoanaerobaculia bacterium]
MKCFVSVLCLLGATTYPALGATGDPPAPGDDLPPPAVPALAAPTETERLLLDRIEKLEKRLSEIEGQRNASSTTTSS